MTDKEMIDEISESLLYCTHKDREVYPWDSSQQQMAKRVIELARLGEKYEQLLADMKERKTGKWIITSRNGVLCSKCKSGTRKMPMLFGNPLYKYCPFCGVKMEGNE